MVHIAGRSRPRRPRAAKPPTHVLSRGRLRAYARTCARTWAAALAVASAGATFALPPHLLAAEGDADRAVTVVQTKRTCFADTLQVTGVLVPRNEILVRPDREGLQISQVLVDPGENVTSGQVLARLIQPEGQQAQQGQQQSQQSSSSTTSVQAPAAGVISSVSAVVGTTASARAEPLFRITRQGEMELLADTPVNTLARVVPKQKAKVEIIGVGELPGEVRLFSTAVNPTTQLGQVHVFVGSDKRLRVGAFGRATIEVGRRCGPAIPLSAVLYGPGGAVVQAVRDSRVETRRVNVGLIAAGEAEIREGLSEGEMVVARAGAFVRDGDRVKAVTAAAGKK